MQIHIGGDTEKQNVSKKCLRFTSPLILSPLSLGKLNLMLPPKQDNLL